MTTILNSSGGRLVVPVIHTDFLTAVHIMRTIESQTSTIAHNIARVTASFERKPIINWVPVHVGILGNELADQDAKVPFAVEMSRWK